MYNNALFAAGDAMNLRKAAEQALEALNSVSDWDCTYPIGKAKEALSKALAQPKQKQKTPLKVLNLTVFAENRLLNGRVYDVETLQAMTNRDILAIPDIGKKALGQVLEALNVYASDMSQERVNETEKREHKPVAYVPGFYCEEKISLSRIKLGERFVLVRTGQIYSKTKDGYWNESEQRPARLHLNCQVQLIKEKNND